MEFNLADIFEDIAAKIPESPVLACGDQRISYAQLNARANRLASHWLKKGLKPGDHIGLMLYNGPAFIEAMIAAFKIRAVPININYRYVAAELVYLFDNADLVALVYEQSLESEVAGALKLVTSIVDVLSVGGEPTISGANTLEAAMASGDPSVNFGPRSGTDHMIIYTGGTTGMPRGVVWQHEDVIFGALQGGAPGGEPVSRPEEIAQNIDPSGGMNVLLAPPLIHGSSSFAFWIALFTGGIAALVPGRSFDPEKTCA